jgi:hypothetical protein
MQVHSAWNGANPSGGRTTLSSTPSDLGILVQSSRGFLRALIQAVPSSGVSSVPSKKDNDETPPISSIYEAQ